MQIASVFFFAVAASLLGACDARDEAATDRRPVVVVSIPPQAFLIERIAGDRVDVKTLIVPGRSPEDFQPLPQQIAEIADATYYFTIGLPFEEIWLPRLTETHPEIEIVAMHATLEAGSGDPHNWTDPSQAIQLARTAFAPLEKMFPASAEVISGNLHSLIEELEILDSRIQKLMDNQANRRFLVYHPAWSHFSDRYGLEQIAFERDGKQPGARDLAELLALCRTNEVQTVFVQPQSSSGHAQRFAHELGVRQEMIDPLHYYYVDNLWAVAELIAGELW
ncbi:MAG: zinc ABC transporter substrate-binding protein [Gammaproteobacteria bacterium]|nr:zinc ABC transporter substrate-binding protein [Gammaproteobacteria bacterium]